MNPAAPQYPGAPPANKGLPPLAWAGIGCGGLLLAGVVAIALMVGTCAKKGIQMASERTANPGKAAAEKMVAEHPELEKVSEDDTTGQMTIRLKDSGESVTLGYAELGRGDIPFKDAAGSLLPAGPGDLAKIPTWVPRYPGATDERAIFHDEYPGRLRGIITTRTTDPIGVVKKFFEVETAKDWNDYSGVSGSDSFHLRFKEGKRELTVIAFGKSGDPLVIQTTYKETK